MSTRTATLGALLIAGAFLIAASLIPYDLTAQESDPITASCVRLTRNLYLGMNDAQTGGQVTKLQRFLTQTGDFTYGHTTGYFGPLTEAAVQQWQCRNMQLCSGGPEENGWGVVGPQTRRAMRVGWPPRRRSGPGARRASRTCGTPALGSGRPRRRALLGRRAPWPTGSPGATSTPGGSAPCHRTGSRSPATRAGRSSRRVSGWR